MPSKIVVVLVAVALLLGCGISAFAVRATVGKAATTVAGGNLREFTLTAEPVRWEIQPGVVVDGWGYNGQIPGPTIHVTEGDLVRVQLVNHLPEPTTIHWHGIDVPTGMDGVPGLSQDAVDPGDTFTYEFVASNPGTRMYHSHTDTDAQIQLGLYGAFIIDPAKPEAQKFDHDYTYILTEKSMDFTPQVAMGDADILHRDAGNGRGGDLQKDLFLMNGRAGEAIDPMSIAAGGHIRIRLINLGNLVHAMHLHGQAFKIIATDGNPVPPNVQLVKDTVLIGPGERYDLEVDGTNPGVWMFHCHINNHAANGMSTVLNYDGYQPFSSDVAAHMEAHGAAAPLPANSEGSAAPLPTTGAGPEHQHAGATASATPGVAIGSSGTATPTAPAGTPAASAAGNQVVMLDNRFVPPKLTVSAGTTVVWSNSGENSHNTTSLTGLWDSGLLDHGQTFQFTFGQPGTYRFLCSQHFLEGMTGTITVTGPGGP
ncbi:MAG TPA: multicopper oxidase domain-containing protein [Bryobacteraceae bacterium]|nr:multicopper oxidase domain-containing protein [Bryobacteraceae bacterium]